MIKNILKRSAAVGAAGIMAFSMAIPAYGSSLRESTSDVACFSGFIVELPRMPVTNPTEAQITAGATTDEGVARSNVTLHKFIQADPNTAIPAKTFSYSITALGVGNESVTGATAGNTDAMPALTINTASTTASQCTTDKGVIYQTGLPHRDTVEATNAIGLEFKYADTANLDVSTTAGVKWPHAGVYRYFVTETNTADADWTYMTDGNTGYEVSVYVLNGVSGLETKYIVINKATVTGAVSDATVVAGDKVDASDENDTTNTNGDGFEFTNRYDPLTNLTVSKTITGNAADMRNEFRFTISNVVLPAEKPDGVTDATKFSVTKTDASATTQHSLAAGSTIAVGGTLNVWLGHGDTFTIADLPVGTTYQVTENNADVNYTATYVVKEAGTELTNTSKITGANTDTTGTIKLTSTTVASEQDVQNTDSFTNDYAITTPTGIILNNLPAFSAVAAGIALAIFAFVASRRKKSNQ